MKKVIQCEGFQLRSWQSGDENSLAENANNIKVWRNVRDAFPHPYTLGDALAWIASVKETRPTANFAIVLENLAIGGIGFKFREDIYRKSAEIGFWLGEKYWGRGIMTKAVTAATAYGFETFGLYRIFANVFEWNPGSARVLEKAGYEFEGRRRNNIIKEGRVGDDLLYATVIHIKKRNSQ